MMELLIGAAAGCFVAYVGIYALWFAFRLFWWIWEPFVLQVLHPLFELPVVLTDALLGWWRRRRRRHQRRDATDDGRPEALAEELDRQLQGIHNILRRYGLAGLGQEAPWEYRQHKRPMTPKGPTP